MNPKREFVFFGTPEVARATLDALLAHGFVPSLVVTNPDAPKGRGLSRAASPVKELALARDIPVVTPLVLDEKACSAILGYGASYALVVAYGKIFPEELIRGFPKGVLNVHYSLLPKYRGATPLEAALLAGDTETGASIQKMTKELDAGDILAQESLAIGPSETAREVRPRLVALGTKLLLETLPAFERGEGTFVAQDPARATRARKLAKSDGLLDLSAPGRENWNRYRAYADSIGTYFMKDGKRHKITAARYENGAFVVERVVPEGKKETVYRA